MPALSWKAALAGVAIVAGAAVAVHAATSEFTPPFMHHMGPGMTHGPGMMGGTGMVPDAATMAQLGAIHALFIDHDKIKRSVETLPDGIRTTTESDDPQVARLLKEHVASMRQRVEAGDDPRLPIESDALHAIFKNYDKIQTTVETTDKGIVVTQTSADKDTVADLQQHAAEVSDFVAQGMTAMRTAMMKRMGAMTMPAGMPGMTGHHAGIDPREAQPQENQ